MARLLAEKGSALLRALEGGLRTGMQGQMGVRMQALLQEVASSQDILFIAVTMPDGTILSHSSPSRLGEVLLVNGREANAAVIKEWNVDTETRWRVMPVEGQRAFVVYRKFDPLHLAATRGKQLTESYPLIFLGLDVTPFEETSFHTRFQVLALAGGILLVGIVVLLCLYFAQRALESRRRQYLAEGQVRVLEEEVRRSEKLAAIGTLAAGVAHEIRNPLSSIKGYATYFGQRFPEGSEDREAAGVMVREAERLNRVITDLIGLSRPTDVHPETVPVRELLEHAERLLRRDIAQRGIQMRLDIPEKLPALHADPDRLTQALLNVCLNAVDAMPQGGVLTLSARRRGRSFVDLEVHDTGKGISPEELAHIFDPYFTTKGQGTGLGLPIVHKIIEAHGGEVRVTSRQANDRGEGGETRFRFILPAAAGTTP